MSESTITTPIPTTAPAAKISAGSLTTARALILLQLLSRLLTFGLNQALVRLAPPEVFGTAAIQFDLICSSVLFLSREGVRNALLRGHPTDSGAKDGDASDEASARSHNGSTGEKAGRAVDKGTRARQDTRLAALPLYQGLAISTLLVSFYIYRTPHTTATQRDFYPSLALYVMSALLELAIEPLYIRALKSDPPRIRVRVQAEGGMAIVRAVVTVGSILAFGRVGGTREGSREGQRALMAFAFGQFAGAGWLAGRYVWAFGLPVLSMERGSSDEKRFDPQMTALAIANSKQSFIKHILTEADRMAVTVIYPLENQGGYAVAMNYGSLIARILFQPIEETLFLHFTSRPSSPLLPLALRISLHIPLLLLTFLPPLIPSVLPILLPSRYLLTDTPLILRIYLQAYIPSLSLNGLLEAYHSATATPQQVGRQMKWMMGGSAAFAAVLYALRQVRYEGGDGLVWASCAAMMCRIGYAYVHARKRMGRGVGLGRLMPGWSTVVVLALAGGVLRQLQGRGFAEGGWKGKITMIGVGGVLGLLCVGLIGLKEWKRWKTLQV